MIPKSSGARNLKRTSLPKFKDDVYPVISTGSLVVYSIHYLTEQGIEARMEDVVFACFMLFPQKFALKKYPRWPDSAAINGYIANCRSDGYIYLHDAPGIKLTVKGVKLAQKVAKVLGVAKPARKAKAVRKKKITVPEKTTPTQPKPAIQITKKTAPPAQPAETKIIPAKPAQKKVVRSKATYVKPSITVKKEQPVKAVTAKKKIVPAKPKEKAKGMSFSSATAERTRSSATVDKTKATVEKPAIAQIPATKEQRERAWKFVRLMERSDAYVHFKKNGNKSSISEFDFRSLLLCTMESSAETLAKNVGLFKGYAGIHSRQDLIGFLGFCEDRFSHLLKHQKSRK